MDNGLGGTLCAHPYKVEQFEAWRIEYPNCSQPEPTFPVKNCDHPDRFCSKSNPMPPMDHEFPLD